MQEGSAAKKKTFWIDTPTLVTLVHNIYKAAAEPSIGYADSERPLGVLVSQLTVKHEVSLEDLESALWASNMLNEEGKFWHPKNISFNRFISELKLGHYEFNRTFNVIEKGK